MRNVALILSLILAPVLGMAQFTDFQKAELVNKNLLRNPGFESNLTGWTTSAGFTVSTPSNVLVGKVMVSWDSSATGQTFSSSLVAIPQGLYGRNGLASCLIRVNSGAATHTLEAYDGANILASQTINSSLVVARTSVNFIFPSSGSISLRLVSVNSNEPAIAIDDCYLGDATNLTNISQATFVGSATTSTAASCVWIKATAPWGDFPADTDCLAPTLAGSASAPSTKVPAVVFNTLPPGDYLVIAHAGFRDASGDANSCTFALSDGTNRKGQANVFTNSTTQGQIGAVIGRFSYTTTQSNLTFKMQSAADAASNCIMDLAGLESSFEILVYRFPLDSQQAYTSDLLANSWTGYHDNSCSFARTNSAFGDPAVDTVCGFTQRLNTNFGSVTSYLSGADKLPGIVFTPKRAGKYKVCAIGSELGATAAADNSLQLVDLSGTVVATTSNSVNTAGASRNFTLCGDYQATSVAAQTLRIQTAASAGAITITATGALANTIEWSIVNIDQQTPAPLLVNSVVTSAKGVWAVESALITDGAATTTVTRESGDWINGVCSNGSTGNYTCTLNGGIFSSVPTCTAIPYGSGVIQCRVLNTSTNTSIVVNCRQSSATTTDLDSDFSLFCHGPR